MFYEKLEVREIVFCLHSLCAVLKLEGGERHCPLLGLCAVWEAGSERIVLCLVCVLYGRLEGSERHCRLLSLCAVWEALSEWHCPVFSLGAVWEAGRR